MKIYSTYSVKIKHYNRIFKETVAVYRNAVDFFTGVCLKEWSGISAITGSNAQMMYVESLTHRTAGHPSPAYDFDAEFYKMPCYIRRAAIVDAIGKVSSYLSNLKNWETDPSGKKPKLNSCGDSYPTLYRTGMYKLTDTYTAEIKIYRNGTWEWLPVDLRKTDMDYIRHKCSGRHMCAPALQKRGREWFLDFPFEEKVTLADSNNRVIGVDLGINSPCVCCVRTRTALSVADIFYICRAKKTVWAMQ